MENGQLQTVYHPVGALIFAEYNPRQLTKDQYKSLRDSMERFGLVDPVIINKHPDRENIVIGGHQRLRIAKDMGIDKVPCVELSLDLNQEKELNVRLNRNVGEWDYDALANYFDVGELTEWGFTEDDLQFWVDEPEEGLIEDDEIPEVEEAVTQAGDLWLLGEHRVLCGDATKKEDVERLMDGQKADMVFTDPPYGVDYDGGIQFTSEGIKTGQRSKIKNDNLSIYLDVIPIMAKYTDGAIYTWFAGTKAKDIYNAIDGVGDIHALLIWVKNGGYGAMNAQYKQKHEPCLYWKPKGKTMKWCGETTENTIWEIDKDGQNKLHPTQKPVALGVKAISNHNADTVLDLFLGSGSTLIACEKTGRKCYGMEIDPHYCDVIVKRWEEFTGKEALRMEFARC
jgi:DNA modification methylase